MRRFATLSLLCVVGMTLSTLASATAASARSRTVGGLSVPSMPEVSGVRCAHTSAWRCRRGGVLAIRGDDLQGVRSVKFLGHAGWRDDQLAHPRRTSSHQIVVRVPTRAVSGPLRVLAPAAGSTTTRRPLHVDGSSAATPPGRQGSGSPPDHVFPIRGRHDLGQSPTNGFGGGRGHKGQDMFASCGTPLVAVAAGRVLFAGSQSAAGNYVVTRQPDGKSYVYMHMRDSALVKTGQRVRTGQRIGYVGETGRATGCHLHFELWTAPGWSRGGHAIDPLPTLRAWDSRG